MKRPLLLCVLALAAACDDTIYSAGQVNPGAPDTSDTPNTPDTPDAVAPAPLALYADLDEPCPVALDPADAAKLLQIDDSSGERWVVEVFPADECTGAGGQHLLMRDRSLLAWLGGHACYFLEDATLQVLPPLYGVVRVNVTATLFQLDPALCLAFPSDASAPESNVKVQAVALFTSRADAAAFAAALDAP